mmetsp:Transcript_15988/g.17750  ORF Transcript_15988/g.17750 Transcript_15988/m.17750 type:complete len:430 (+) Transcript_15988:2-1291(+)
MDISNEDALYAVVARLDIRTLGRFGRTCKRKKSICDSDYIWKQIVLRETPTGVRYLLCYSVEQLKEFKSWKEATRVFYAKNWHRKESEFLNSRLVKVSLCFIADCVVSQIKVPTSSLVWLNQVLMKHLGKSDRVTLSKTLGDLCIEAMQHFTNSAAKDAVLLKDSDNGNDIIVGMYCRLEMLWDDLLLMIYNWIVMKSGAVAEGVTPLDSGEVKSMWKAVFNIDVNTAIKRELNLDALAKSRPKEPASLSMVDDTTIVWIQSQTGKKFPVEYGAISVSALISDLFKPSSYNDTSVGIFPSVNSITHAMRTLVERVQSSCCTLGNDITVCVEAEDHIVDLVVKYCIDIQGGKPGLTDEDFDNFEQSDIFGTIMASYYLGIRPLIDISCRSIARRIRGKTPAEIRKQFNIESDFTPEEEAQVRKENEWCEE